MPEDSQRSFKENLIRKQNYDIIFFFFLTLYAILSFFIAILYGNNEGLSWDIQKSYLSSIFMGFIGIGFSSFLITLKVIKIRHIKKDNQALIGSIVILSSLIFVILIIWYSFYILDYDLDETLLENINCTVFFIHDAISEELFYTVFLTAFFLSQNIDGI